MVGKAIEPTVAREMPKQAAVNVANMGELLFPSIVLSTDGPMQPSFPSGPCYVTSAVICSLRCRPDAGLLLPDGQQHPCQSRLLQELSAVYASPCALPPISSRCFATFFFLAQIPSTLPALSLP